MSHVLFLLGLLPFSILATTSYDKNACERLQKEFQTVRLVPFVSDGVLQGWAVRDLEKASELKKRGLMEHDLLVQIGPRELNSADSVKAAIEQMCSTKMKLTVTRRKKSFTIELW